MTAELTIDRKIEFPVDDLIGAFRTFGADGPTYQILSISDARDTQDVGFLIQVVETGEELDYPLASILNDPVAA